MDNRVLVVWELCAVVSDRLSCFLARFIEGRSAGGQYPGATATSIERVNAQAISGGSEAPPGARCIEQLRHDDRLED